MDKSGMKRVRAFFFATQSGHEPVRDWLMALDREDRREVGGTSMERAMKKTAVSSKCGARTGSSLESALAADGLLDEAEAVAIKRVIAWELEKSMRTQGITKQMLATRMSTSRSQLDRLLDPQNSTVQLDTVARAARALGKRLEVRLVGVRATNLRRAG